MKTIYHGIYATVLFMFIVYASSYHNPSIADFMVRFIQALDLWSLVALPIFLVGAEIIESNTRVK